MSPACRVDVAQQADVPQILALMRQYWAFENIAGFDAELLSQLLKRIMSQPHLGSVWVARANDVVVGYLIAVRVFSFEYRGIVAEIDEMFVIPPARGSGVGAALVKAAEVTLSAAGCTSIQLQLGVANDAARAFYRRRGYVARSGFALMGKSLVASAREEPRR
jgi:GNAT superfamily N-acetyltransferase